jgi:hypothetical protein
VVNWSSIPSLLSSTSLWSANWFNLWYICIWLATWYYPTFSVRLVSFNHESSIGLAHLCCCQS